MPADVTRAGTASASSVADLTLFHQKAFAPYKIATLIDTALDHGIAVENALAATGLNPDLIHDRHALTSIADYITACENVIAAGADLSIAFDVGSRLHLSVYGMYGFALVCSPTVRDFFDFAVRYHLLATPMVRLGWRQEGDLAIWEFTELYGHIMSQPARDFLVRQQLKMTVTHVHDIAGPTAQPVRALLNLPKPGDISRDENALGCPCQFDAPRHELHYPISFLDHAPQLANRLTHQWLEETCNALMRQGPARSDLAADVYQMLFEGAPDGPNDGANRPRKGYD